MPARRDAVDASGSNHTDCDRVTMEHFYDTISMVVKASLLAMGFRAMTSIDGKMVKGSGFTSGFDYLRIGLLLSVLLWPLLFRGECRRAGRDVLERSRPRTSRCHPEFHAYSLNIVDLSTKLCRGASAAIGRIDLLLNSHSAMRAPNAQSSRLG